MWFFLLALLFPLIASAQSVPNGGAITPGQVWTPAQWTNAWSSKADAQGGVLNNPIINNPTITGGEGLAAISFVQQINLRSLGATGNGTTDDSAALTAAVTNSNAIIAAGGQACIYAPSGIYLIKTAPPVFTGPGCVIGDGRNQTYFKLDQSFTGALFRWDDAWIATNYPYSGTTLNIGAQRAGPHVEGIAIVGNQSAGGEQDGFLFLDRADFVVFRDIAAFYLPGRAFYVGKTGITTQAYMRESKFYDLMVWGCGTATLPAFELSSVGTGDATNTLEFHGLDVVGSAGDGLVIRNQATSSHTRLIHFYGLRIEGNGKNGLTIGDPSFSGIVDEVQVYGFRGNNSAPTYATILTTADAGGDMPFNIMVNGTIDSGSGNGVVVNAGRNLWFNLTNISVSGTGIIVGPTPLVGSNILFNGNGAERSWTKSVDSSAANSMVYPVSSMSQTNTNNAAQSFIGGGQGTTVTGFQAGAIAGFNQVISGNYSIGMGSRTNDKGRIALVCHSDGEFSAQGDAQQCYTTMHAIASSTTAVRLTGDGGAASAVNIINIPNNTAANLLIQLEARDNTTPGTDYSWTMPQALLHRDTTIGSTAISLGTPTIITRGIVTGASVSLAADTTNGGIDLEFTPPSGNSDTWHVVARVSWAEVQ